MLVYFEYEYINKSRVIDVFIYGIMSWCLDKVITNEQHMKWTMGCTGGVSVAPLLVKHLYNTKS